MIRCDLPCNKLLAKIYTKLIFVQIDRAKRASEEKAERFKISGRILFASCKFFIISSISFFINVAINSNFILDVLQFLLFVKGLRNLQGRLAWPRDSGTLIKILKTMLSLPGFKQLQAKNNLCSDLMRYWWKFDEILMHTLVCCHNFLGNLNSDAPNQEHCSS